MADYTLVGRYMKVARDTNTAAAAILQLASAHTAVAEIAAQAIGSAGVVAFSPLAP